MSTETRSTTLRCLNHFVSSSATRPSMPSVLARRRGLAASGRLRLLVLLVEDRLDALLLAPLHDAAILGQVDRDRITGDDVVVLPHARVADEHHALLQVEVLRAPRRARLAVLGDDPHTAGGHRAEDAVALLVEVDLHAIR